MNKILFCLLIVGVLVAMPVLAACGGAKETTTPLTTTTTPPTTTLPTTTPLTTTTPTTTPPTTTPPTTTPPTTTVPPTTTAPPTTPPPTTTLPTTTPGETLGEILGRAEGITSVKYDMLVTSPGVETITTKIWIKNNKMRMEMTVEGQLIVTLLDMDAYTMYLYYPDQNMAMKVTYEPTESAIEEAQSIPDYNPTIIGTETMDGKVCLVVEYTIEGQTVKLWIWKDKGFPIRVEMTTTEGKIVIEYKNIEFIDIPDSMFEVPEGVPITDMSGM